MSNKKIMQAMDQLVKADVAKDEEAWADAYDHLESLIGRKAAEDFAEVFCGGME